MGFLATYIMRGRWQAATAVSVLAFLSLFMPPISIVSSAALALVTLRRGAYEGLTVFGISLTGMTVLGAILGSVSFTALYGLVLWLPIWIVAIKCGGRVAICDAVPADHTERTVLPLHSLIRGIGPGRWHNGCGIKRGIAGWCRYPLLCDWIPVLGQQSV